MPTLSFSSADLKKFFDERSTPIFYEQAVEMAEALLVHSGGAYPKNLIESRRPNESIEVQEYRKRIWIKKTKPTFDKIVSTLAKIRRSSEWSIRYVNEAEFTRIPDGEKLSDYCEQEYPQFKSITNWVFSVLLKKYLIDPNAVALVYPMNIEADVNEILRPIVSVFSCHDVMRFHENDYCVLRNPAGSTYNLENGSTEKGKSFYIVTTERIQRFDQINSKGDMSLAVDYVHDLGMLPAFQLGAIVNDQLGDQILYESRISGIVPELDEAVREYSDLQAAKVLHMYPERFQFTNTECRECKGHGKVETLRSSEFGNNHMTKETCSVCNGVGYTLSTPFTVHLIRPAAHDEQPLPNPPIGYVEKDIEIIKVQEESVTSHIYNALAAHNLEFLVRVPQNQSGIAKEYDKDESNNTAHAIGEDIVRIMDKIYHIIATYRYGVQYTEDEILSMLPMIAVPERFDISSSMMLEKEIESAKKNKMNPKIINRIEVDFANKRYTSEPEFGELLSLTLNLDPMANITEEEKVFRLQNRGVSNENYIISSNIDLFVERAIVEDASFPEKPILEQRATLQKYAAEFIAKNSSSVDVIPQKDTFDDEFQTGDPNTDGEQIVEQEN